MAFWADLDELLDGVLEPDDSTEGVELAEHIALVVAEVNAIKAITDTLPSGDYSGG